MKKFKLITLMIAVMALSFHGAHFAGAGSIIAIDGSSTVYPITEAVAEEFQKVNAGVKVTVGISGTGGGFKRFCRGETDISDASRPIKASEVDLCFENGIKYVELPVAYDGLAVMVNPSNTWATTLTVAELKKMWEPEAQGKITNWNQIRADFPDQPLTLVGPGTDSGTYDYFTEAIVGKGGSSRGDYIASEDDNVLVQAIANDPNALGFFGLAYYEENKDKLKLVAIDGGKGPVLPSKETVNDGTYQPLSRPIFIYVSLTAADRQDVAQFVEYYLQNAAALSEEVGYIKLPEAAYAVGAQRFKQRVPGSVFKKKDATVGVTIDQLLSKGLSA
jgi:phosphate transport system substrate-binding protein